MKLKLYLLFSILILFISCKKDLMLKIDSNLCDSAYYPTNGKILITDTKFTYSINSNNDTNGVQLTNTLIVNDIYYEKGNIEKPNTFFNTELIIDNNFVVFQVVNKNTIRYFLSSSLIKKNIAIKLNTFYSCEDRKRFVSNNDTIIFIP